jgi:hypothetical protein
MFKNTDSVCTVHLMVAFQEAGISKYCATKSGFSEVELRFRPRLIMFTPELYVPIMCMHRGARPKVNLRLPNLRLNTCTQND